MPHVSFVSFTGLRVQRQRLLDAGMTMPGLAKRGAAVSELPALGLLTLAGCTPDDWTCSYHHAAVDLDAFAEQIAEESPNLVAVSALTASIEQAYRFSGLLRDRGVKTVLGGLHATACPAEAERFFDAVVVGEGERCWAAVLADVKRGELQARYESKHFPVAGWPLPRFDLINPQPNRYTLQTQRGCPWACEFCAASRLLGAFREKPTSNIRRELESLSRLDRNPVIELADDNTFAGNRSPQELFSALANAGARYFTEADWRIGLRPEVLSGLAASGCVQVLVGVESATFRYPGMGKKDAEFQQMLEAIQAIQQAGVAVNACFIIGAEGETRESIDQLVRCVLEGPFADVQLALQTPFPGTRLHERLKQSGRLLPNRGWSHYTLFDVTYQPDTLSVEELEDAFDAAAAEVYSPAATARRSALRKSIWKNNPRLSPTRRPRG